MKLTNLFIDYIVIGIVAVSVLSFPYYFVAGKNILELITQDTKNKSLILPYITILIYVIGIVFNQLSDLIINKFQRILFLEDIKKLKSSFKESIRINYHEGLQLIVCKSRNALDYLSYRRSILRIIRSLVGALIVSHVAIMSILLVHIFSPKFEITFTASKWTVFGILIILSVVIRSILIKVEKGYYSAVKNFYTVLKNDNNE